MLTREVKVVYLLYVLASSILLLAAGDELYGKKGGEITLSPGSLSASLTRIVWKHGDDKAIEWEGGQTDAYRQFRNSTTVNEKTGEMRITKLNSTFNGVYSSDVNGIQATKRWTLTVLDPVSKPIIDKNCTESKCELSCKNEATVKVQCAWRKGEELQKYDRTLVLEKTDDTVGKAYICNCSNPVSFAVSDEVVPFPRVPPVGLILGLLFLIIIIVIGVIALIKRKQLKESVRTRCGTRGNSDAADKGGAKDPEDVPLNKNAAGNQDGANETSEDEPIYKNAAGNQDGANETSEDEPIYKNAAGNQDGANETSEVPETLDNTIDDKAAPLTPTNGDKPPN